LNNATQIRQYHKERIATATLSWSDRVQMAYERMVESIKETLNYSSDSNDGKVNPPFRGAPPLQFLQVSTTLMLAKKQNQKPPHGILTCGTANTV
jgi:hypothetical protein